MSAASTSGVPNWAASAAYLAKAGMKVLVLERRHLVGGAAVTEEIYPGFKYSVCSYVVSLLRVITSYSIHYTKLYDVPDEIPAEDVARLHQRYTHVYGQR